MYIVYLCTVRSSRCIRFRVVNCNFRIYFWCVHIHIDIYNGGGVLWKSVLCILFVPWESFSISFLVCLFMTSSEIKYLQRWTRTTSNRNGRGDFNNSDVKLVIFMSCVFVLNLCTFYFRLFYRSLTYLWARLLWYSVCTYIYIMRKYDINDHRFILLSY